MFYFSEEEIYADLGLVRKPHQNRSHSAAARLCDWRFEPKEKRDFVLVELLETEANYVDVLNRLRKNFIRPITTICESDKKIIFMNIKELGDIHTAFFTALFNCVKEKPHASHRIGEKFIEFKVRSCTKIDPVIMYTQFGLIRTSVKELYIFF